jgi:branched-chain amino acid transport system substrate-binding protein
MNKTTKIIIGIVVVLIVIGGIWYRVNKKPVSIDQGPIKIGAILPLTGPAAIWGENIKNGMDLAAGEDSDIEISYQDSKAVPADGLAAYTLLTSQGVDAIVSAFSAVSIPLKSISQEKKIPLIMTIVAAENVTNDFSYRYYATTRGYVEPTFKGKTSPLKNKKTIAVLYRNDEFGVSVNKLIKEYADNYGKNIIISEPFKVNEVDFATSLTKIKEKNPEAILFIPATPAEAIGILQKAKQLDITSDFIENSTVLSDSGTRNKINGFSYYTTGFEFSFAVSNPEFKEKYFATYGKQPQFSAVFGYDIVKMITKCKEEKPLNNCLNSIQNLQGITGDIENIKNHEINPPTYLMKIDKDGQVVPYEE